VIGGTAASQAATDTTPVNPFSKVTITDPNAGQAETVTITLSAAANGSLSNLGGGSYSSATGVYSYTASATAVTAAVDGLVFTPTPYQALPGTTITTGFTISDTDSAGASATDTTTSVIATATGTVTTVPAGGTVTIGGSLPLGEDIVFSPGAPGTLILGSPTTTIPNVISGFAAGDRLEFANGITINSNFTPVPAGTTLSVTYHNASGTGTYLFTNVAFSGDGPLAYLTQTDFATGNPDLTLTTFLTWVGANGANFSAP
jgi:hypothetical protein